MDSPEQTETWHSSYGRRAAQLCHCEMPPVQWTKHCCRPVKKERDAKQKESVSPLAL